MKFFQKIKHRLPKKDKVLEIRGKLVFIGGEQVSQGEMGRLREDARRLKHSLLWEVFTERIHKEAYDIVLKSEGEAAVSARMMIHNIDVLDKTLKALEKIK